MFGGGGGLNPRKMQQMMKQMGIEVTDIDAVAVRIETADGEELVFDAPDVTRMDAQGQQTYQIVGDPETRAAAAGIEDDSAADAADDGAAGDAVAAISDDDVELVAMRTGASEEEARAALEEADGDLAAAVEQLE